MKRTIALLLTCLLTASLLSGCGSSQSSGTSSAASDTASTSAADSTAADTSDNSKADNSTTTSDTTKASNTADVSSASQPDKTSDTSQDTDGQETSVDDTSDTTPDTSQPGIIIDEDGNIIIDPTEFSFDESDEDSEPDDEDPDDEQPDDGGSDFLDLSYQMTYLSPEGFTTGTTLPAAYYITSAAELSDFVENNTKTYSLDVPYTNDDYIEKIAFTAKIKDMDDSYFSVYDSLIVVAAYNKDDDCDLGSISIQDDAAIVEIWAEPISSADKQGYICFVVNLEKGILNGKTIAPIVTSALLDNGEEE